MSGPGAPRKETPEDFEVDPTCGADEHGYYRAHRRGCTCPGPALESWKASKAGGDERRRARDRERHGRDRGHVTAPDFHSPAVPEPADLGREALMVFTNPRAACRGEDPELFFPLGWGANYEGQVAEAKAVCARCPISRQCLDQALEWNAEGVWGGTTDDERRGLRRGRRRAQVSAVADPAESEAA